MSGILMKHKIHLFLVTICTHGFIPNINIFERPVNFIPHTSVNMQDIVMKFRDNSLSDNSVSLWLKWFKSNEYALLPPIYLTY